MGPPSGLFPTKTLLKIGDDIFLIPIFNSMFKLIPVSPLQSVHIDQQDQLQAVNTQTSATNTMTNKMLILDWITLIIKLNYCHSRQNREITYNGILT